MMIDSQSILIVDDEPNLRKSLSMILQRQGYTVSTAADAEQAYADLQHHSYDLIFLDIKMPKKSGLTLLTEIRQMNNDVPILLLTAFASLESAIEAVRRGANDYLLKPIDPPQILARVKQILAQQENNRRREIMNEMQRLLLELNEIEGKPAAPAEKTTPQPQLDNSRFIQKGVFILDLQTRSAVVNQTPLFLTPTGFDYLVTLLRHSPETIPYQKLVLEAQGYETSPIEAKEVARWRIHELRKTIEDDTRNPNYIITVRGIGYRLVP
ncbi:MAG: response regulator transcription factor [Chloroflexi bacterium]|nr:response regulator transcription factor [Chloroflexota bacterium]MBP7042619.1 response regulator transcription factor [Chloroflexota bacterium]